jgi:hypothetical protein
MSDLLSYESPTRPKLSPIQRHPCKAFFKFHRSYLLRRG